MNSKSTKTIIFIGDFYYNAGSTQTLLYYKKIAEKLGYDIVISGYADSYVKKVLPVIQTDSWPSQSILIYIFENILYLDPNINQGLLEKHLRVSKKYPHCIIDTDARYEDHRWKKILDEFEVPVLQPKIYSDKLSDNIISYPFFCFPEPEQVISHKKHDMVYVGNNWKRTEEMSIIIDGIKRIKNAFTLAIYGKNWKKIIDSDDDQISLHPSVPSNAFLHTQSLGEFSPILISKELLEKKLYTPRMFETIAADTLPLIPDTLWFANEIFGSAESFIYSPRNLHEVVLKMKENKNNYINFKKNIQQHLQQKFSPEVLLTTLVSHALEH